MKITWTTGLDASCWHTLLAVERRLPLVDADLLTALDTLDAPAEPEVRGYAGAAAAGAPPPITAAFAEPLARCRAALAPRGEAAFVEQLRLRAGPLREQWEARGPGLLRQIGRLTEPAVGPRAATVALVWPAVGGHGEAFPVDRSVAFEAVLANPHAELPEIVRLGWLLAQLDAPTAGRAVGLALVPAVLEAANEVELVSGSEALVTRALKAWRPAGDADAIAPLLSAWWRDYRGSMTPWTAAIADLAGRLP